MMIVHIVFGYMFFEMFLGVSDVKHVHNRPEGMFKLNFIFVYILNILQQYHILSFFHFVTVASVTFKIEQRGMIPEIPSVYYYSECDL